MDLEIAFLNFAREVKKNEFKIDSDIPFFAKNLLKILKDSDNVKIMLFKDSLYDDILKIKYLLTESKDPSHRSYHDQIFKNYLKMTKSSVLGITKVFGEFVKGITYFEQGEYVLEKPVYHRLMSCGDGLRNFYQQCNGLSNKRIAKRRIETCYIERLIYNELYINQRLHFPTRGDDEMSQDEGHRVWLEQTKSDFNSCFPNVDLRVKLEYRGVYPIFVKIERYKHNRLVSIETYAKDRYQYLYSALVECNLQTYSPKAETKQKVQTFSKLERWRTSM